MSRGDYVQTNVRNVHPDIRKAVVADALEREVTLSDVVGEILAQRFRSEYEPSGRRATGLGDNGVDQFLLSLPVGIVTAVYFESKNRKTTQSSVVQMVLADHYGLPFTPVSRSK